MKRPMAILRSAAGFRHRDQEIGQPLLQAPGVRQAAGRLDAEFQLADRDLEGGGETAQHGDRLPKLVSRADL